jgi:hypothetical protein
VNHRVVTLADREAVEAVPVPGGHCQHVLNHVSSAVLGLGTTGTVDIEWEYVAQGGGDYSPPWKS